MFSAPADNLQVYFVCTAVYDLYVYDCMCARSLCEQSEKVDVFDDCDTHKMHFLLSFIYSAIVQVR